MSANRARLLRLDDLFVFIGPLCAVAPHRHRATALLLAVDSPFRIKAGTRSWETVSGAIIPPGLDHALDCGNQPVAVLYFDPLTHGQLLDHRDLVIGHESTDWVVEGRRRIQRMLAASDGRESRRIFCADLHGEIMPRAGLNPRRMAGDARLLELRQLLEQESDWNPALASVSARIGLSSFHFSHMFSEKVGLAWTAYRNWMRLLRTCAALDDSGATLTQIAMDGGYSSPAHFSASFRTTFGITPSQIRPLAAQAGRFHCRTANI